jgi:ribosomal protein L11 methyltransferase
MRGLFSMLWIELSVALVREQAPLAELVLEQQGALAITFQDDADNPVLEPGPGTTPLWPIVQVRGLFEAGVNRQRITDALQIVPGISRPQLIRWRDVEDQDWERAWMDRFQPMKFGQYLWIVPTGMQISFDERKIEVRLDPGLAFGTGTPPTTALCLEWLDGRDVAGCFVVDYGCGSGILGIAAALKGASRVICVDNDPQALEATSANAVRNSVANIIECQAPEEYNTGEADIVLANVLAGPLIKLAPLLLASVKPGGQIVLSGVLEEQSDKVEKAYRSVCAHIQSSNRDGWVRLDARKL